MRPVKSVKRYEFVIQRGLLSWKPTEKSFPTPIDKASLSIFNSWQAGYLLLRSIHTVKTISMIVCKTSFNEWDLF